MEIINVTVQIQREEKSGEKVVKVCFDEPKDTYLILTNQKSDDVEKLFNNVFNWIIDEKKLLKFVLEDNENDLFKEIVDEIIKDLNSEILQSQDQFMEVIEVISDLEDAEDDQLSN